MLALEQRGRLGDGGRVHAPFDRTRPTTRHAIFGGRCQGVCPMWRSRARRTIRSPDDTETEDAMAFIQVKVIEGVFTTPQKQEIIERVTDAIVAVEGESMRRSV